MIENKDIIQMIRNSVKSSSPDATVIIYGSQARGDYRESSDIDVLILLDKEKINREDEKKSNIRYTISNLNAAK